MPQQFLDGPQVPLCPIGHRGEPVPQLVARGATAGAASGVGVAAALTVVLFWVLQGVWGIDAPPDAQSATTVLLGFGGAILGGWLTPPRQPDPMSNT